MGRRELLAVLVIAFTAGAAPGVPASPWAAVASPIFVRLDPPALPHPDVRVLAQDAAGFIWIGTPGGLARFDGYEVRSYLPNPSDPSALPEGWIRALLADPDGDLWIGTESSGLVHFDQTTRTFHTWRAAAHGNDGPRSSIVNALARGRRGRVWIGGDQGLDRFDPGSGTFAHFRLSGGHRGALTVVSLFADREGGIWAGTLAGLFRADGSDRFRRVDLGARYRDAEAWSEYEDASGRVWIGSNDAVFVIDRARRHVRVLRTVAGDSATLAVGRQTSIAEPSPGVVWIGSGDGDISIVDTATWRVRRVGSDRQNPGGATAGQVESFLLDRSGLLWIAKGSGGLLLYNPHSRGLYELSATLPRIGLGEDGAPALAALGAGRLWVGRLSGALTLLRAGARPYHTALPNRSTVLTMSLAPNGTLWIGTFDGLCKLARGARAPVCGQGPAQVERSRVDAVLDDGRTLWVGTREGLIASNRRTGTVRVYREGNSPHALTNRWVTALLRDRQGRLWIGTQRGLNRLDRDGRITQYAFDPADPRSIGPGVVSSLLQDRGGRIWAGAIGGPLDVLQPMPGGTFAITRLGVGAGLPHQNADALAQDDRGRIWVSTPRGIAMFALGSLHARAFGFADGVSEGPFHAGSAASAGGTAFFGGFDGITVVAPGASSQWTYASPIVVTALQLGRGSVPAWPVNRGRAALTLPAGRRRLSVEFAALDYPAPRALRYAYKLDGYNGDWTQTDAQHRIATYTNLAPGAYTFRVRATNRLGAWTGRALALHVRVLPAWYETWWFRALAALAGLALLYAAHRLRTAVLRRRQRALETTVAQRTQELSEANRALELMSLTDPLTGLHNRRFLTQSIEEEVALALRRYRDWLRGSSSASLSDADVVFFMIDIDHFKAVNDEHGHAAGDRVLAQMRPRLESVLRDSDYVVRWGGEEFLVVARRTSREEAGELAERLRESIACRPFELEGGRTIFKTASVGFAAFPFVAAAPEALSWFEVIELSDEALYLAKSAGRNRSIGLSAGERTSEVLAQRGEPFSPETFVQHAGLEVIGARSV